MNFAQICKRKRSGGKTPYVGFKMVLSFVWPRRDISQLHLKCGIESINEFDEEPLWPYFYIMWLIRHDQSLIPNEENS